LTGKLSDLQKSVDKALAGVPALTTDTKKTLAHINALTTDTKKNLSPYQCINSGFTGANQRSTKPQHKSRQSCRYQRFCRRSIVAKNVAEIKQITHRIAFNCTRGKKTAKMLDNNPQSLLLGPDQNNSGPVNRAMRAQNEVFINRFAVLFYGIVRHRLQYFIQTTRTA